MPLLPLLAATYLGIGLYRTQRKTVDAIADKVSSFFHKAPAAPPSPSHATNEPIWHAAVWPIGLIAPTK